MRASVFPALLFAFATSVAAQPVGGVTRADAHYQAGWQLFGDEDFEGAAREFQNAIEMDHRFALAHYGLGRSYMALKRFVHAVRAYTLCRDLYAAEAGERAGAQLDWSNRFRDQQLELEQTLREYQQRPQTQRTQKIIREIQEQLRQLTNAARSGWAVDPDLRVPAFVSLALGSAYFRSDRLADAEREYLAAIKADSKLGEAHNNLAVVYLETGRYVEAEKHVKLAERAGYRVHPQLKQDIKDRKGT